MNVESIKSYIKFILKIFKNFIRFISLMTMNKILLVLIVSSGFLLIFYANNDIFTRKKWFGGLFQQGNDDAQLQSSSSLHGNATHTKQMLMDAPEPIAHNIFIIFTKENEVMRTKLELFLKSLLKYASVRLHLHIITDERSEAATEEILKREMLIYKQNVIYTFYDVEDCAIKISDITQVMMPHFSSTPGSYYSDALFYLSLGLHRIVDVHIQRAILIDCDVVFRTDVKRLFDEFDKFANENIFGLAPELTPVYHHILYKYRAKKRKTIFGTPYYPAEYSMQTSTKSRKLSHPPKHGYPGLNSGVVMINLNKMRKTQHFHNLLMEESVERLTKKYYFKGHLGDQDYYTLLSFEHPNLFYRLDCVWNRQLCTWWKDHGYSEIFDSFFHCEGKIHLYHGNCNTRIPE